MGGDVRFGSLADIRERIRDVRFIPRSRHAHLRHRCPLSARSRRWSPISCSLLKYELPPSLRFTADHQCAGFRCRKWPSLGHLPCSDCVLLKLGSLRGPPLCAYQLRLPRPSPRSSLLRDPAQRSDITQYYPWLLAFSFGLLHGLGFACALAEVGLRHREIPLALFSFNVGVECGQLAFIATVLSVICFHAWKMNFRSPKNA